MITQAAISAPTFHGLTTRRFLVCLLVACLFFQRFGIAIGGQAANSAGPVGLLLGMFGLLQGTIGFDRRRLFIYLFLVFWVLLGMAHHAAWPDAYGVSPSSKSVIQFLVLTSFFTLSFTEPMDETEFFHLVNSYFGIIAIAGIIQFFAQYLGVSIFSFDGIVPNFLLVEFGWNLQIGSGFGDTLKSNGFFLLEPSIFSQFMAIALIIEALAFKRMRYLCLFIAALFLSFSGTGWIILATFVVGVGASLGVRGLMLAVATSVILGLALTAMLTFSPEAAAVLTSRTDEIFIPLTSGHLRFVTPFWLLSDVLEWVPSAIVVGLGPGVSEHLPINYLYNVNTPIKITLEFGLPAFIAYLLLFVVGRRTPLQRAIVLPAIVMVLITGSYAQFPPVLFLAALIISVARLRPSLGAGIQMRGKPARAELPNRSLPPAAPKAARWIPNES